jgi:hypothetical protein
MNDVNTETPDVAPVKTKFWVKYDFLEDAQEVAAYARAKKLDVPAFLRFSAQSYMDKYPRDGAKRRKAVQPYASGGKS